MNSLGSCAGQSNSMDTSVVKKNRSEWGYCDEELSAHFWKPVDFLQLEIWSWKTLLKFNPIVNRKHFLRQSIRLHGTRKRGNFVLEQKDSSDREIVARERHFIWDLNTEHLEWLMLPCGAPCNMLSESEEVLVKLGAASWKVWLPIVLLRRYLEWLNNSGIHTVTRYINLINGSRWVFPDSNCVLF